MIGALLDRREADVSAAFESLAPAVQRLERGQWDLVLDNDSRLWVRACLADGWLCLDLPVPESSARPSWDLLRCNAGLPGLAKLALGTHAALPSLRAEIPLDDETDLDRHLKDVFRGMVEGYSLPPPADLPRLPPSSGEFPNPGLSGGWCGVEPDDATPANQSHAGQTLEDLCREAGWQTHARSGGRLAVDLELGRRGLEQAIVEALPGGVRISAILLECESLPDICREAVGQMMLRVCGIVRMARVAVNEGQDAIQVRCEVLLPDAPSSDEIDHALSAISMVVEMSKREARALCEERVAGQYLAMWAAKPASQNEPSVGGKE